eukprot:TRINITY_DN17454_c0_g1_i9.p1 TRINITY_DN17454_c0_g1~~TRINITY_DN17454_c0_g1_i9.p1  ORF type:complete len:753 (-),score=209.19 TRINITY_DN17454_c0_g1_i9:179-2437(-)
MPPLLRPASAVRGELASGRASAAKSGWRSSSRGSLQAGEIQDASGGGRLLRRVIVAARGDRQHVRREADDADAAGGLGPPLAAERRRAMLLRASEDSAPAGGLAGRALLKARLRTDAGANRHDGQDDGSSASARALRSISGGASGGPLQRRAVAQHQSASLDELHDASRVASASSGAGRLRPRVTEAPPAEEVDPTARHLRSQVASSRAAEARERQERLRAEKILCQIEAVHHKKDRLKLEVHKVKNTARQSQEQKEALRREIENFSAKLEDLRNRERQWTEAEAAMQEEKAELETYLNHLSEWDAKMQLEEEEILKELEDAQQGFNAAERQLRVAEEKRDKVVAARDTFERQTAEVHHRDEERSKRESTMRTDLDAFRTELCEIVSCVEVWKAQEKTALAEDEKCTERLGALEGQMQAQKEREEDLRRQVADIDAGRLGSSKRGTGRSRGGQPAEAAAVLKRSRRQESGHMHQAGVNGSLGSDQSGEAEADAEEEGEMYEYMLEDGEEELLEEEEEEVLEDELSEAVFEEEELQEEPEEEDVADERSEEPDGHTSKPAPRPKTPFATTVKPKTQASENAAASPGAASAVKQEPAVSQQQWNLGFCEHEQEGALPGECPDGPLGFGVQPLAKEISAGQKPADGSQEARQNDANEAAKQEEDDNGHWCMTSRSPRRKGLASHQSRREAAASLALAGESSDRRKKRVKRPKSEPADSEEDDGGGKRKKLSAKTEEMDASEHSARGEARRRRRRR